MHQIAPDGWQQRSISTIQFVIRFAENAINRKGSRLSPSIMKWLNWIRHLILIECYKAESMNSSTIQNSCKNPYQKNRDALNFRAEKGIGGGLQTLRIE